MPQKSTVEKNKYTINRIKTLKNTKKKRNMGNDKKIMIKKSKPFA